MGGSAERGSDAGIASQTWVVAAHVSFFILKQLFEVFDEADDDDDRRPSHSEEEERHDYFCHETNDKIHRALIVPPIGNGTMAQASEGRW